MKYGIALLAALLLNATANLMMKFGVRRFSGTTLNVQDDPAGAAGTILSNWVLILGLVFFASNAVLYTFALARIPISVAYPIMVSGGFVIIALVAWRYLGETLTPAQWVGIVMILVGVYLVARNMQPAGS